MATTTTDRIEKKTLLRAPRARVWRALTDSKEFGAWFGMEMEGAFEAGKAVAGRIKHTGENDPMYRFRDMRFEMVIDRIEPERLFSYRWHPGLPEPGKDYSSEPMTLVEITLTDDPGGTLLTVVESGFDAIPSERSAEAFHMNTEGWDGQMMALDRYLQQRS